MLPLRAGNQITLPESAPASHSSEQNDWFSYRIRPRQVGRLPSDRLAVSDIRSQLWKYQWPIWLSWRNDAFRQLHADFETCEQQAWAQSPLTGFGISFLVSVYAEDCSGLLDVWAWRCWRVLVIKWKRFGRRRGSAFRWREQMRETGLSFCFYSQMSSWSWCLKVCMFLTVILSD